MKILIYGVNYAPELTGIGKYMGEMAEWLVQQGHDVYVVTAAPYYPNWKVSKGYSSYIFSTEVLNSVRVMRCPLYVPTLPSGIKRIIHLITFAISSMPIMLKQVFWKPDVVFVVEPPLFCAPTAWAVSRLSGAKCWLHIQDFEVDAAFDLGIIPFAWMRKFVSSVESWLMRRFDVVSTISNSMLNRLQKKEILKPVLFPNWADLSRICFDKTRAELFRTALEIGEDATLCLYSGNIAVKQGLDILLDVAQKLPDCQFVICGEGANRKALEMEAEKLLLDNLVFLPLQPLDKLAGMLSAADIHLVIQKKGVADLVLPSKLTNILAVSGLALVTAERGSELGKLANEPSECVYRCDPEDASDLVDAIVFLRCHKPLMDGIKAKAKQYAQQKIDKEQVLLSFEDTLKEVTK